MHTSSSVTACRCQTCGFRRAARPDRRGASLVQPDLDRVAVPRDESFKVWSHGAQTTHAMKACG